MLVYKIDDDGLALDLYVFEHHPKIEVNGKLINDPKYISEPIPNDIFVSDDYPAKWIGEEWVATGVDTEPIVHEPTIEERIQALEVMELERILGGHF